MTLLSSGKLIDGHDQNLGFNAQIEVYEDLVKLKQKSKTEMFSTLPR